MTLEMRKSRPINLKLRQILQLGVASCVVLWLLTMLYSHLADRCGGRLYTYHLCEEYRREMIAGALCEDLCKTRTVYLTSCDRGDELQKYRTFYGNSVHYQVKMGHLDMVSQDLPLGSTVFLNPTNGTSMEQFQEMVAQYLTEKLGSSDHQKLTKVIMKYSDVNHDSKVTLAEAKTIWSLLQHNEFFMLLLFRENEHTPNLAGFCGDVYAVEDTHSTYLYSPPKGGLLDTLFPKRYQWSFPPWEKRAKIVMGMLEYTSEMYQHESLGSFYMCDIRSTNIGYSDKFDSKFVDLSAMLPKEELQAYLHEKSCESSADCVYTPHCTTTCDKGTCSGELVYPNLHLICRIFEPYIKQGAPRSIQVELINLLDKCFHLSVNKKNHQLEHSLLLNEFKSLLWKQISES